MPYIGSSPNFGAVESQTITTANGSTASFTLNQFVPDSDSIIVTVGNVVQEPTTAYSAVGTTITFTENVPNGDTIVIRYLGRSVDVPTTYTNINRFKFVATGGQDTFQNNDANGLTLSYTVGNIDVFMNGVRLDESDFTASNGTSVVLGTNASASDEIIIIAYKSVVISNGLDKSSGGTVSGTTVFSGQTTFSGQAYFSGGIFGDVSFDSGVLKIDSGNNRVGVNTNSPSQTLDVQKSGIGDIAYFKGSGGGGLYIQSASTLNTLVSHDGSNYGSIRLRTGSADATSIHIDTNGKLGIGTTSPQDPLHAYIASGQRVARFEANSSTSAHIAFKANNTSLMPAIGVKDEALYLATHDAHERFRIKDNGRILIGDAGTGQSGASLLLGNDNEEGYGVSGSSSTQLKKGGKTFILKDGSNHSTDTNIFWSPRSTGWSMFYWNKVNDGGSDNRYVDLYFDGTTKGTIKYNTSTGGINYNTSSDYRLKDNIKDIDINILYDDIKKLKVKTFKFKKDVDESADDTVGFIAHEVQEVIPQLCDTPKDAMKDNIEGRTPKKLPDYQQLDYGKFTPFIIGALQKAMEKIETLEAKVKALEEA